MVTSGRPAVPPLVNRADFRQVVVASSPFASLVLRLSARPENWSQETPLEELAVVWTLEGYSKADDTLRTEHPVNREQLLRLRKVLTPDADDPWMLHCHPVPLELWPAVEAILRCGSPHPELDYLVSASAARYDSAGERRRTGRDS